MSISFSGLGSGLDTASWVDAIINAKKIPIDKLSKKVTNYNTTSTNLTNLKGTYTKLLAAITKLTDSNLSTSANVFAQNKITSSNESILKVTSSSGATPQSLDVVISGLASNTVAKSGVSIGKNADGTTVFSGMGNGAAKTGSFSFYVDNQKFAVDITKTDTLDDIKTKMVDATKSEANPDGLVTVTVADGKFTMDAGDKSIILGSTQDVSNFASTLSLKKDPLLNKYSSTTSVIDLNMNAKLTGAESGFSTAVKEGTIKIGKATFTIDANTTLNSLMNKINTTADSGVMANIDPSSGKFSLTSKSTGAFNISAENGTSNFLESVGLTSGSKLVEGTQTLGKNALLTINGKPVESFSNTVTSESTGLAGLVFNLNDVTETGKSIKVKVEQDGAQSLDSVKALIAEFNTVITKTDDVTKNDSGLKYETSLVSIKNKMRSSISSTVNMDSTYKTLADIGITTGKVGTIGSATTNQLQIDETKFKEALANDPTGVKELLVGNTSSGKTGFAGTLKTIIDATMDTTNGYFASKDTTIKSQVKSLNDQISRRTMTLDSYRKTLTAQFTAMDQTISKLKGQYNQFGIK